MIEISENYFLISQDEVSSEMEPVGNGVYRNGENLYEVVSNAQGALRTPQNPLDEKSGSTKSSEELSYTSFCFICSILLLAFAVLCFYLGITNIVDYGKVVNESSQLGEIGGIITDNMKDLLRDGILWLVGGVVSFIIGVISSKAYNSQKK